MLKVIKIRSYFTGELIFISFIIYNLTVNSRCCFRIFQDEQCKRTGQIVALLIRSY